MYRWQEEMLSKRYCLTTLFFNECQATKEVHLKIGAQVMLLKNLDLNLGLVNGSRGVIESWKCCPVLKSIINEEEEELVGPDESTRVFPGKRFEDIKYGDRTEYKGKKWRVSRFDKYPLVRFVNNVGRILFPEVFERKLYRQGSLVRKQVPLKLAWALRYAVEISLDRPVHLAEGFICFYLTFYNWFVLKRPQKSRCHIRLCNL